MPLTAVIGVDIGTSSSKGVLVALDGTVLHTAVREHAVDRPAPGHVEMDATVWWDDFVSLARELTSVRGEEVDVAAVGVSGMGPCVLLADADDTPLRPAILYGVDTRSVEQIDRIERELGAEEIVRRCGSRLTTQAAGPKVAWVAAHEPDLYRRARHLYMPSSWLVRRLTGTYVLDHHSASQCTPLYDIGAHAWHEPWAVAVAPGIELPPLAWSGDRAGTVTEDAARRTGLRPGIPVVTGTIDAWAEALSVGAHGVGDLMLMYGTTMFLVHTVPRPLRDPALWSTVGALPGTHNLAGGMATSGAVTGWLRELFGSPDYAELLRLARESGPGAHGLLMLPYFAGERSPVMDPRARGVLAGLTLSHTRGDLYRAALEGTAYGVRHNIEAIEAAGGDIRRVVAVGGGTQGDLWTRIVSDVTGRPQEMRQTSVGACYGGALLAAGLVGEARIDDWNPVARTVAPAPETAARYDETYTLYRELYPASARVVHALADHQART
ncbi:FGGY-family carbohydrate kinase [Streptomyces sp. VRA16 Mangrove soil]|uniref:FGGY-family carbohydrate kinase n=1 Tax=Streptomyces sp. VRA16 Mangrove soil TaxID=2817434 RepID=UPI001A9F9F3B|nr:FGGY-family carbohydrate kinase [Streptomyces sp. VRA16 Mangrove soil]MBO1330027.1 FGGY-family carbohydrate kinase [Streptomyces sp. VRA16 Mangrove soil]